MAPLPNAADLRAAGSHQPPPRRGRSYDATTRLDRLFAPLRAGALVWWAAAAEVAMWYDASDRAYLGGTSQTSSTCNTRYVVFPCRYASTTSISSCAPKMCGGTLATVRMNWS